MLLAYWQAGQYFVTPDAGWQEMLLRVDRRLGLPWRVPAFIEAILELAYALCYAMVPAGLGALLLAGGLEHAASYWRMVLPPAYSCYALVPLLPMLPPRALETLAPPQTALRRFNLWVAARGSIHANTFPSAHVAASLAVALALLRFAPAAGWVFLVIAAGIAMGAVVGRYHYALDAVLGAALVALAAVIES
jgi:membrane-associated phospholipid phosphatase